MTWAATVSPTEAELAALPDRAARAWRLRCVLTHLGGPIYRLEEADGSEHLVDLNAGTCDGADAEYRGAYCKHLRRAAIGVARGEVPPPDSPRIDARIEAQTGATYSRCTSCGYESIRGRMARRGCPRCREGDDDADEEGRTASETTTAASSGAQGGGNCIQSPARTDGGNPATAIYTDE